MKKIILFCVCYFLAWPCFGQRTVMVDSEGQLVYPELLKLSGLTAETANISSLTLSPQRWYAVLVIPAGEPSISLGGANLTKTYFTDFKLKAYVQTDSSSTLKFRYNSFDPTYASYPQYGTTRPDVYYTSSTATDARRWKQQNTVQSIYAQKGEGVVGGWVVVVTDNDKSWFNPYNKNLGWGYVRYTNTSPETDAYGYQIWRPIYPIWTTIPPSLISSE